MARFLGFWGYTALIAMYGVARIRQKPSDLGTSRMLLPCFLLIPATHVHKNARTRFSICHRIPAPSAHQRLRLAFLFLSSMSDNTIPTDLPLLAPGQAFPPVAQAWRAEHGAAGLLAVGGDLSVATLKNAYSLGIFPWFSAGEPILWWSPEPRMVLAVADFKLQPSLKRSLKKFVRDPNCEIRVDHDFAAVIAACANSPRAGQAGTWILPQMQAAYVDLHRAGLAHSIETWVDGKLIGGLYCSAIGQAVFGESMFAHASDASKIALAALVAFCHSSGISHIDCQQNTRHLASLGAAEMPRADFCAHVQRASAQAAPVWNFHKGVLRQLWQDDSPL